MCCVCRLRRDGRSDLHSTVKASHRDVATVFGTNGVQQYPVYCLLSFNPMVYMTVQAARCAWRQPSKVQYSSV